MGMGKVRRRGGWERGRRGREEGVAEVGRMTQGERDGRQNGERFQASLCIRVEGGMSGGMIQTERCGSDQRGLKRSSSDGRAIARAHETRE